VQNEPVEQVRPLREFWQEMGFHRGGQPADRRMETDR
jgi:hypothetical protein